MDVIYRTDGCSPQAPRDEHEARDLDRLVFVSVAVGLSTITPENVREWLVRLLVWNEHFGLDLLGPGELAVIRRWIGLHTSAGTKTREEWLLKLIQPDIEQAEATADEALVATA